MYYCSNSPLPLPLSSTGNFDVILYATTFFDVDSPSSSFGCPTARQLTLADNATIITITLHSLACVVADH